jgi:hypothetical protein
VASSLFRRAAGLFLFATLLGCGSQWSTAKRPTATPPSDPPAAQLVGAPQQPTDKPAELSESEIVKADGLRLQKAALSGDGDTFVELVHPEIIEKFGGPERAKQAIKQAVLALRDAGMRVLVQEISGEPTFFSSDRSDFVLVPTRSVFEVRGVRVEARGYVLGGRPRGERKWVYVEGNEEMPKDVRIYFPDFPDGQEFPPVSKRQL